MKFDCTGVILAGGTNSRLPGKKKTFHKIGDATILESICRVFSELFREIIIVVNEPREFAGLDLMTVTDVIPARCALAGLHTGLFYSSFEYSYITACDVPFLNSEVVRHIVSRIDTRYDVIVPKTEKGLESLSAVYSKKCMPRIEENLRNNIFMIKKFYNRKKVKEIPIQKLAALDPELRFILNINTPADLERAKDMAGRMENE